MKNKITLNIKKCAVNIKEKPITSALILILVHFILISA